MHIIDIITRKQAGSELSHAEINWLIKEYISGRIPDYQMTALLMAIYFQGMSRRETVDLTLAMIASGSRADLSAIRRPKVDKHSTGGVGDKVSLLVAPIAASLGVAVPMISGRGLGHTGGTLDKLESIPGFTTNLSLDRFAEQIAAVGCALIGQSDEIVPADQKIYALRDVTGTVRSIPLITASILSKKVAEGAESLLLDVKFGRGAVFAEVEGARELAINLVAIGSELGMKVHALLTNMDQPLGCAVGNWLEVRECLDIMAGKPGSDDLRELSMVQAALMLQLAGKYASYTSARQAAEETLSSGRALEKFIEIARLQGANLSVLEKPDLYPQAEHCQTISAMTSGYVQDLNALAIGKAAIYLGAGRLRKEDDIDNTAGLILHKKRGDSVQAGDPIVTLYTSQEANFAESIPLATAAYQLGAQTPRRSPLILSEISEAGEKPWTE
ncbi:MAG: thymidine phosphorylase [bacterium]|nr:thymidine phosphorylase [bacterium]